MRFPLGMACWQVLCYCQGVYNVHHFTILRVPGFLLVGRDESLPRWHHSAFIKHVSLILQSSLINMHHSTIIHHLSILNLKSLRFLQLQSKQVRKYVFMTSSRGKKNRRQSQKTAEAQQTLRKRSRAEGKKQFVFNPFFRCEAWVF